MVPVTLSRTSRPKTVLIVGAGLAGLSAALELKRAGHNVTVLEAQLRAGGRVQTLREPFSNGLHAEAGAIRVPGNHNLTLHYIQMFGLQLEPFLPAGFDEMYLIGGKRIRAGKSAAWPLELSAAERAMGFEGMWEKYVVDTIRPYLKAPREPWPPAGLGECDGITLPALMRKRGATEAAVKLLNLGFEMESASAVWTLVDEISMQTAKAFSRIRGGNDRLPKALAARLASEIRYGAAVKSIRQSESGVEVACGDRMFRGDYLLCTIPPPVLKGIDTNLSAGPRRMIDLAKATPVTRVYAQTRRRFWLDDRLSGVGYTDEPIARVWPNAGGAPGERGVLHTYTWGDPAHRLDAMEAGARLRSTVEQMDRLFPGTRENFEGGTWKSWAKDEWARGAFAEFGPGEMAEYIRVMGQPDGRVYFAGEHASSWGGWMQGALQTGLRAAEAIHRR